MAAKPRFPSRRQHGSGEFTETRTPVVDGRTVVCHVSIPGILGGTAREVFRLHGPRQLALPTEVAVDVCEAMVEFSLFLGCMGRLRGGREHGRSLARLANTLEGAMRTAIAEYASYGTPYRPGAGIGDSAPDLA